MILIYLTAVFNMLDHDLIVAMLYFYGFDINYLTYIWGYITLRAYSSSLF